MTNSNGPGPFVAARSAGYRITDTLDFSKHSNLKWKMGDGRPVAHNIVWLDLDKSKKLSVPPNRNK